MKKKVLSVVGLLLMGAATAMASNTLVLHLASGQTQRFVLLNEQPTISFTGDDVVVKTSTSEMVYTASSTTDCPPAARCRSTTWLATSVAVPLPTSPAMPW